MLGIKKLLVFLLVFAILIVVKEIFLFAAAFKRGEHIDMTITRQVILGISISYIMTIICTGFSLF